MEKYYLFKLHEFKHGDNTGEPESNTKFIPICNKSQKMFLQAIVRQMNPVSSSENCMFP